MAHDIVIIITRANRIAKNADTDATTIELRDSAVAADTWLQANPSHGKAEADHEWLESVEKELGNIESLIDTLHGSCPV